MTSIVATPIEGSGQPSKVSRGSQSHSIQSTVPVLVLADSALVLHHGTLGIIRSLGRIGIPVYTVTKDRFTPAAASKYLTGAFIWQPRGLNAQEFVEGMNVIYRALSRTTVLVPTDDCSAILIAEHASALEGRYLFPKQHHALPRLLANKRTLYLLCKQMQIPFPRTCFPVSAADLDEFVESTGFPVIVKAGEPWLAPPGVRSTTIARNRQQLHSLYKSVASQHATSLIVQEYIGPEHGEDWFYHGYINTSARVRIGFTGRKLRSYPPSTGPTTFGRAIVNDTLHCQAEHLLGSLEYCGIMDLDYRFDKRDGQYKLVDFNPRIGAQFRLFEDIGGVDLVRALYFDLIGRPVRSFGPITGRTFIADFHDIAARLCERGNSARRDAQEPRSSAIKAELAWFCTDDFVPFLLMCIRLLLRLLSRLTGKRSLLAAHPYIPKQVKLFRYSFSRNRRTDKEFLSYNF